MISVNKLIDLGLLTMPLDCDLPYVIKQSLNIQNGSRCCGSLSLYLLTFKFLTYFCSHITHEVWKSHFLLALLICIISIRSVSSFIKSTPSLLIETIRFLNHTICISNNLLKGINPRFSRCITVWSCIGFRRFISLVVLSSLIKQ